MTTLTWDNSPPTRPALSDVGGLLFENDDQFPPPTTGNFAGTFPTAAIFNQQAAQIVALGRLVPAIVVQVDYIASVPYIVNAITPGAALDNFDGFTHVAPFTITEHSAGDLTITWTANMLPGGTSLTFAIGGVHSVTAHFVTFQIGVNGFEAFTYDTTPTGVRVPFTFIGF